MLDSDERRQLLPLRTQITLTPKDPMRILLPILALLLCTPAFSESTRVQRCVAIVTACSPQDAIDQDYYAKNGYAGSTYNICADFRQFPKGTLIRVPGYMDKTHKDKWWVVDASGGSIIRRSVDRGHVHIDVKYRTEHSALKWGRQKLTIEYILPAKEKSAK